MRVEDGADRPGIDRAVGVPAGPLIDRAHVETGRAADAAQRLPAQGVGEHVRTSVVDEDHVDPVSYTHLGKGMLLALHLGRLKDAGTLRPEQVSLGKLNNVRESIAIARECRCLLYTSRCV